MSNDRLPSLPGLPSPAYVSAQVVLCDAGRQLFKAVVAGKEGDQDVYVFKLRANRNGWDMVNGDWQSLTKPAGVHLAQDGADLLVTTAGRISAKDYPSTTFIVRGACRWWHEMASPLYEDGEYASVDEINAPVDGVFGFVVRFNRQLRRLQQVGRYLRFLGALS